MRTWRRPVATLVLGLAAAAAPALLQEPTPAPEPRKIAVTARKYEFEPSKIELRVGETAEITFTAEDTTHGFSCPKLGVEKVVLEKGKPTTVRLTPDKAGTFEFKCAKFCGFGHGKMHGVIVVTEAEPAPH